MNSVHNNLYNFENFNAFMDSPYLEQQEKDQVVNLLRVLIKKDNIHKIITKCQEEIFDILNKAPQYDYRLQRKDPNLENKDPASIPYITEQVLSFDKPFYRKVATPIYHIINPNSTAKFPNVSIEKREALSQLAGLMYSHRARVASILNAISEIDLTKTLDEFNSVYNNISQKKDFAQISAYIAKHVETQYLDLLVSSLRSIFSLEELSELENILPESINNNPTIQKALQERKVFIQKQLESTELYSAQKTRDIPDLPNNKPKRKRKENPLQIGPKDIIRSQISEIFESLSSTERIDLVCKMPQEQVHDFQLYLPKFSAIIDEIEKVCLAL